MCGPTDSDAASLPRRRSCSSRRFTTAQPPPPPLCWTAWAGRLAWKRRLRVEMGSDAARPTTTTTTIYAAQEFRRRPRPFLDTVWVSPSPTAQTRNEPERVDRSDSAAPAQPASQPASQRRERPTPRTHQRSRNPIHHRILRSLCLKIQERGTFLESAWRSWSRRAPVLGHSGRPRTSHNTYNVEGFTHLTQTVAMPSCCPILSRANLRIQHLSSSSSLHRPRPRPLSRHPLRHLPNKLAGQQIRPLANGETNYSAAARQARTA